ncbi:hypothetical protein [Streptomyces sp. NPDC006267]|uniref:hypothetical protein n=1 Tax=Streptomyces sp. NPDC006267 TaxID=3157173 RepID=UPI0033A8E56C
MPGRPTLFRALVEKRQWENWSVFACHAVRAAHDLAMKADEPRLLGVLVPRRSFDRWMLGELDGMPQRDHQVVLEHLLGYPCAKLFGVPADVFARTGGYLPELSVPRLRGQEYGSPRLPTGPGEGTGGAK